MQPVGFQVKEQENNGTQGPGDRVRPENYLDRWNNPDSYSDVGDSDYTPADHHNKHGDDGFSGSPQKTGNAVGKG